MEGYQAPRDETRQDVWEDEGGQVARLSEEPAEGTPDPTAAHEASGASAASGYGHEGAAADQGHVGAGSTTYEGEPHTGSQAMPGTGTENQLYLGGPQF